MADEADSKSVVGNHVWVQVPLPAFIFLLKALILLSFSKSVLYFFDYLLLTECFTSFFFKYINKNFIVVITFSVYTKVKELDCEGEGYCGNSNKITTFYIKWYARSKHQMEV